MSMCLQTACSLIIRRLTGASQTCVFVLVSAFWENALMKAVRIHQFGGPEVLTYEDIADPQPRKHEVLVRVRACSLNHLDVWVRKGLPGVKLPHILGSDVAGEVVEVGEYVSGFKAGQRLLLAPR